MGSFFKMFFASLLSLVIFFFLGIIILFALASSLASKSEPEVPKQSVLVLDLGQFYNERLQPNPLSVLSGDGEIPGLYDLIRLINKAKTDDKISGIYVQADINVNGYSASNEIREALIDFKTSKKFVLGYGNTMSQGAYFVANVADKIYLNPAGSFEWKGFAVNLLFVKQMLEKLEIKPQIFYAGKFKSATEIFRTTEMTPENELQTREWLGDLYQYFLVQTAQARKLDTATLHALAANLSIVHPEDAVTAKLIDGVKYDDEVKSEIKQRLSLKKDDKMNFLPISTYYEASNLRKTGKDRIAIIYAEGTINDGEGTDAVIGGESYRQIIRKARMDASVKAIVLRVNSGGGSALASEIIWRELKMAKEDGKPVVVSFGDVAASGGYYIACGADSIFANPNTITGSIGVFGVIPNMQDFLRNKLGITFDGVSTAPYADGPSITRPLMPKEEEVVQQSIERIYAQFKQRVAEGRKLSMDYVDSIAQGRVWSGQDALRLRLVDKLGDMNDAIASAARLAKIDDYGFREYPESKSWLDELMNEEKVEPMALLKKEMSETEYRILTEARRVKEMCGTVQARLPYNFLFQ